MSGLVSPRPAGPPHAFVTRDDRSWRGVIVAADATIGEAMAHVDRAGLAIVVDAAGRLLGTVTDADIRRALLSGASREAAASPFMTAARGTAPSPIIDGHGHVIGVRAGERPSVAERLVVILAGGWGLRLRPLTTRCPKPLLRVGGRPLLEMAIERLAAQGFRRLVLCVGYRAAMIERYFGSGRALGVEIDYVRDGGRLGTAGPLGLLPARPASPFVVMNGDLITAAPVDRLVAFHDDSGADATMAVCEREIGIPFGVVQLHGGRVAAIDEKPAHRCFVNAGIYVLDPSVLDTVGRGVRRDMPVVLEAIIARGGQVGAFPLYESWADVGSRRDFEHAAARVGTPSL